MSGGVEDKMARVVRRGFAGSAREWSEVAGDELEEAVEVGVVQPFFCTGDLFREKCILRLNRGLYNNHSFPFRL